MPTKTINRIHFTDLDPIRFEDLCMNLVSKLRTWKELNHYGRKGDDGGVDIKAIEETQDGDKTWFIQCKRYSTIKKSDLKLVVDKVSTDKPDKLLLIVACDLKRELHNYFSEYSHDNGISKAEIWTASNIESDLYSKHHDLLFIYFGIQLSRKTKSNESKIKHKLRMQKKMHKDFIMKDWYKEYKTRNDPSVKFKWAEVYIRSIDDTTYPKCDDINSSNSISGWFKSIPYDFYHNGLELWLMASAGHKIIMDNEGKWEPLSDYYDPRQNDPRYKTFRVKLIGQIPYESIVEYNLKGDEYDSLPHIFCKFQFNGEPYEKIKYKLYGKANGEDFEWELDEENQTVFPKE